MRKMLLWAGVLAILIPSSLWAQDISGDWQGTLDLGIKLRIILHVEKGNNGALTCKLYSIDQGTDGFRANSVTFKDLSLEAKFDLLMASYEGKVSADGNSITGTWTQRGKAQLDFRRAAKETAWSRDSSPHTVQFIAVDTNVKLEVLDWGGSGHPLIFLAGLGNTAHVFDKFAPKFSAKYHVYGITRRGFGESSTPDSGYSADRLGDDVLAVMDALKIDRPVLVGHSIAGEELSSVGSRHPEKVAGLVYLDAAYPYAFYDAAQGDLNLDSIDVKRKLDQMGPGSSPQEQKQLVEELLKTDLPQLEKDLQEKAKDLEYAPTTMPNMQMPAPPLAIIAGEEKYTKILVPVLAIYAIPHSGMPAMGRDEATLAAAKARDNAESEAQAKAFEKGVPTARVVRLPNADHFVFTSNEGDVLREMNAFLEGIGKGRDSGRE